MLIYPLEGVDELLAFEPKHIRFAGKGPDVEAAQLVAELKALPSLVDFADAIGNMQSAVRLDIDGDGDLWVTVPVGTDELAVAQVVNAHVPQPVTYTPPPTPEQVATQMADTITTAVNGVDPATGTVADLRDAIINALTPYVPSSSGGGSSVSAA